MPCTGVYHMWARSSGIAPVFGEAPWRVSPRRVFWKRNRILPWLARLRCVSRLESVIYEYKIEIEKIARIYIEKIVIIIIIIIVYQPRPSNLLSTLIASILFIYKCLPRESASSTSFPLSAYVHASSYEMCMHCKSIRIRLQLKRNSIRLRSNSMRCWNRWNKSKKVKMPWATSNNKIATFYLKMSALI